MPPARILAGAALLLLVLTGCVTSKPKPPTRTTFRSFSAFSSFARTETAGGLMLLSPEIEAAQWDELIASWNVTCPPQSRIVVEARAFDGSRWTRFYTLGVWSEDNARESVRGQHDRDAIVKTDTLVCKRPMRAAQLRLTLISDANALPSLKFVGVSLLDSAAPLPPATRTNMAAWGRLLDVPRRSQLGYKDASGWCSPTSVSMMLAWWARQLNRPDLDVSVPEVAGGVYDPNWSGTGNWAFNMAYAGDFRGLRAFVTRYDELAQVEDWIAAGVPVALSVSFDLLDGREKDMGNGHLIVVVGFTEAGDVIVNDPWPNPKRENSVRKIFPRQRVLKAWQRSKQTVYVICPEAFSSTK